MKKGAHGNVKNTGVKSEKLAKGAKTPFINIRSLAFKGPRKLYVTCGFRLVVVLLKETFDTLKNSFTIIQNKMWVTGCCKL